jgi:hypothetical protein
MKQLVLAILALLFCFTFSTPNVPDSCLYSTIDGSANYNLTRLHKSQGKPYTHVDEKGNEWIFNVCGDLEGLDVQDCPKDAVVCKRTNNVTVSAGKTALWKDYEVNPRKGVEIIYGEGDSCGAQDQMTTIFDFVCKERKSKGHHREGKGKSKSEHENSRSGHKNKSNSEQENSKPEHNSKSNNKEDKPRSGHREHKKGRKMLFVKEVKMIDNCTTVITVESWAACQKMENYLDGGEFSYFDGDRHGDEDEEHERGEFFPSLFAPFILFVCFLCLCACVRRRRAEKLKKFNQEKEMLQFSDIAFHQIPQEAPMIALQRMEPQAPQMSPNVPRNQSPMPSQFIQAPQYFLYPSVQAPLQQAPASLNSPSADEILARALQAQFDREANM